MIHLLPSASRSTLGSEDESIHIFGQGTHQIKRKCSKGNLPIHPSQGEPWNEPTDEEVDIKQLYQIHNDADYAEPNIHGELNLGNQDSVGYNTDAELYDWEIENYKTQARGC